jgi:hypothetical protein
MNGEQETPTWSPQLCVACVKKKKTQYSSYGGDGSVDNGNSVGKLEVCLIFLCWETDIIMS